MLQTRLDSAAVEKLKPGLPGLGIWSTQVLDEPKFVREPDFHQLASVLLRRWRSILAIAASGTIIVGVVGFSIPPKYTATAQLLIETPRTAPVGDQEPGMRGVDDLAIDTIVDTHMSMLASRDFLRRVIGSLAGSPERQSDLASADQSQSTVAQRSTGAQVSGAGSPGIAELKRRLKVWIGSEAANRARKPDLEELDRNMKVRRERRSRIISVSYTSSVPMHATDVVNRVVQMHIDRRAQQQRELVGREIARVCDRIAALKAQTSRAALSAQSIVRGNETRRMGGGEALFPDQRMRELLSEATAARQLQLTLERRIQDLTDQQASLRADVSILSPAVPPDRPSSPNPLLFVFPSMIIFTICGALLAVARERLDRGLRSERDVVDTLGIPCMGLVPQLGRRARKRAYRRLLSEPSLAYTEAIRSIVAQLQLTSPRRAPKVVLVSSSVPREGKTTLAVSLAAYGAFLGRRVLLVDVDFRHPSLFRELKRSRVTMGAEIIDLLLHDQMPTNFVEHLSDLKLDYLPLAHCPADPLFLFAGDHLQRLKRLLCENYDCVILDGPPLIGIAEARLLGPLADQVLFVVKWGSTRREVAQTALDLLRSACFQGEPTRAPAAIVTQVNLKKQAKYRFGDVAEAIAMYKDHYTRVKG